MHNKNYKFNNSHRQKNIFLPWYIDKKKQLALITLYESLSKNQDIENSILRGHLEIGV